MKSKSHRRSDITGAILAGGKSSRMGWDKGLLDLDGMPFIEHIARTLQQVFARVMIVSDNGEGYRFLGLPIHADIYKNCGPLAGVHSGLTHSTTDSVFIVSCDLPVLTPAIVRYVVDLKKHDDVTLLSTENNLQPLCGLYKRHCLPVIEQHLKHGQYSVLRCLQEMHTVILSSSLATASSSHLPLMNVNTPYDYEICLRYAAEHKKTKQKSSTTN